MEQGLDILLRLLRGELQGTAAELPELSEEELNELYRLSKTHEVAHMAAAGLRRAGQFPTGELAAKFKKELLAAAYSDDSKTRELKQISEILSEAGIAHLPLKGAFLRALYPEPWMRTRCDIDILVHPEDLEQACEALRASGRTEGRRSNHDVPFDAPGGVHTELHYVLHGDDELVRPELLERVWDYALPTGQGNCYALPDDMFYFCFLAHTAKHVRNGGCGVRAVADIWLLEHVQPHDQQRRDVLLAEGGLLSFDRKIKELAEAWFTGGDDTNCTEECKNLGDYILHAGVYGSRENWAANRNGDTKDFIANRIFRPYDELCKNYPSLEKAPYLLPAYQVVRWVDLLFRPKRVRAALNQKQRLQNGYDRHDEIEALMESVGLQLDADGELKN